MDERKNTIGEEARPVGERVSGAAKDVAGAVTGDQRLEREGERERAEGRARQAANDVTSPLHSSYVTGLYRYYPDSKPGQELTSGTKAAEGLGVGSAIGGGLGAAFAAIFAVGTSVAIPGLGLVVAGPIAAALAGAGAGGATGGLIGALVGAGIPEERARLYDKGVREGGIVLGARARDEAHARELERDYQSWGGSNVIP